jgi:hypothetical protein
VSERARALLDEFQENGWRGRILPAFLEIVDHHPDELPALVEGGLERGLKDAHFLGEAVSHLPENAVAPLVRRALEVYARDGGSDAAEDVVSQVGLQFPHLLHPHLAEIFTLGVNASAYYHGYPWRGSGERAHPFLLGVLGRGGERAKDALDCLLETRTPAAFAAAERYAHLGWGTLDEQVRAMGFGRDAGGDGWRALVPAASYHLRFPDGYAASADDSPFSRGERHPTWRLDADGAAPMRFGGEGGGTCALCGEPLAHLLTLAPPPEGLGVTGMPALVLETCLQCVWTSPSLEYVHDAGGRPSPHRHQAESADPEPTPALRPAEVRLVPTPARWWWQDWALANGRQNLNRLGGHPAWVQSAEYPDCPDCGRAMGFLLQLEAGLPGADGGTAFDEGVLYGFWCDACRVSAYVVQMT